MQERPLFDRHTINGDCEDWIILEQLMNFVALLFLFGKGGFNEAPSGQSLVQSTKSLAVDSFLQFIDNLCKY